MVVATCKKTSGGEEKERGKRVLVGKEEARRGREENEKKRREGEGIGEEQG